MINRKTKNTFYFSTNEIEPLAMVLGSQNEVISVKLAGGNKKQTLSEISSLWDTILPHQPIRYDYLDDSFESMYSNVSQMRQLFSTFSGIAMFIASLGLLALSAFSIELRRKEVSIRKVLGASALHLMTILTSRFFRLILIALAIAIPAGILLGEKWLENYAYRTEMGFELFVLTILITLLIAAASVLVEVVRSIRQNPAETLKME